MYKLLLDSSDTNLSVGISKNDEVIYKFSTYAWQRQSEYMIPEINNALKKCGINLCDVSVIVLGIGPGSYTGVRIPLTIAKTLNVSDNVEIIALSSLRIMGKANEKYIALMNARSSRSYIGVYSNGEEVVKDFVILNDEIESFIKPYIEQGYVLKGNLEYLNLEGNVGEEIIDGLLTHSLICNAHKNPKSLCPSYLKD